MKITQAGKSNPFEDQLKNKEIKKMELQLLLLKAVIFFASAIGIGILITIIKNLNG